MYPVGKLVCQWMETEDMEKVLVHYSLTNFREEEKGGQKEAEWKEGILGMWENWAKFSQVTIVDKALWREGCVTSRMLPLTSSRFQYCFASTDFPTTVKYAWNDRIPLCFSTACFFNLCFFGLCTTFCNESADATKETVTLPSWKDLRIKAPFALCLV